MKMTPDPVTWTEFLVFTWIMGLGLALGVAALHRIAAALEEVVGVLRGGGKNENQ